MKEWAAGVSIIWWVVTQIAGAADAGGTLASNTVWSPSPGTILVHSNVVITNGITLTVEAGTTVQLSNGVSLLIQAGGTLAIEGTGSNLVHLEPMVAGVNWGRINASGANSTVTIRFAEIVRGGVSVNTGATGLVEDSYLHDYAAAISGNAARLVTMRRIHVNRYSSVEFNSGTIVLAEDSLFENVNVASGDALEIQNGPPGSVVRRCTFRYGLLNNTDAVDFNGSTNVVVEDCLIHDFSDKGVSLGTATTATGPPARGIVVQNCLIYNVDSGVAVKDFSTASLYNNTIIHSAYGVRLYEKYSPYNTNTGGGQITNAFNNIIWANTNLINTLSNGSVFQVTYSDLQSNWPGTGNITGDPLFLDPAQLDFRLAPASPAAGTGFLGMTMGARFPVGAPMALSHPRVESADKVGDSLELHFWADEGKAYSVQFSDSVTGDVWTSLRDVPAQSLPQRIVVSDSVSNRSRFYRVVIP